MVCVVVYSTPANPTAAYFSTITRAWELGIGALIALQMGSLRRIPRPIAQTASWLGLAAILVAGDAYSPHTEFPGYAAALPVAGAGLILAT